MESSRVRYEIAYDKTKQSVIVYPQWRGTRPNHMVIGDYTPENPQGDFEEYRAELGEAIRDALKRVGQLDAEPFQITIVPLNGDKEFVAKERGGPMKRVPLEDQVPVSADKPVAEVAHEEQQKGEPVPHATQASKEMDVKAVATKDDSKPPATKKAAKKKATKDE